MMQFFLKQEEGLQRDKNTRAQLLGTLSNEAKEGEVTYNANQRLQKQHKCKRMEMPPLYFLGIKKKTSIANKIFLFSYNISPIPRHILTTPLLGLGEEFAC